MIRATNQTGTAHPPSPWNWSRPATFVLLAFVAIGLLELGGHDIAGAVVCFVLAGAYVPLRIVRGRLSSTRVER